MKFNWKALFGSLSADDKKEVEAALKDNGDGQGADANAQSSQSATTATGQAVLEQIVAPHPEVAALQQSLETLRASVLADKKASIKADAETFYLSLIQPDKAKAIPAQRTHIISDYIQAATDDLLHPLEAAADGKPQSRVEQLKARYDAMPSHKLTTEQIKSLNLKVLGNDESADPLAEAQKDAEAYAAQRNGASAQAQASRPRLVG